MNIKQITLIFSFAIFALNNLYAMPLMKKKKARAPIPSWIFEAFARNLELMGASFGIREPMLEQLDEVLQKNNNSLQNALTEAVRKGYSQIIPLLISRGAKVAGNKRRERYLLNIASKRGDVGVVETLIRNGARVGRWAYDDDFRGRKIRLSRSSDDGVTQLLKPSEEYSLTPLEMAVKYGYFRVVKLLCKHGRPEQGAFARVWNLLGIAIERAQFDITKELFFAAVGLFSHVDVSSERKREHKERIKTWLCIAKKFFLPNAVAVGVLLHCPEYVTDSEMLADLLSYCGHSDGAFVKSFSRGWCQDILKSTNITSNIKDAVKEKIREGEPERATLVCKKMSSETAMVLQRAMMTKKRRLEIQPFFDPDDTERVRRKFMSARCDEMFEDAEEGITDT